MNLLIVDDDDALRLILSDILTKEGYTVITASDGFQAVELTKNQMFDLVLLDIVMPNMDGFEVLKFIKENYPSTKVVMLTAYTDLRLASESRKLGADDFVAKPCMRKDLLNTIQQVLRK